MIDRVKMANELHERGANCAQSVACSFADVVGLDQETLMKICGTFGGGFRAGEICGVVSGAGVILGMVYPHAEPENKEAKEFVSEKIKEFVRRFKERFPSLACRDIKELPCRPEASPAAQRLGITKTCGVYIVSAVEILEEMLAE